MNILVISDDYWHPARTPRAGLVGLEPQGFHLDWIEDAKDWSAEKMAGYPVVILTKSNNISASDQSSWMEPAVEKSFVEFVERGGGLLVVHSGLAGYTNTNALRPLMGGVFVQHPAQCPVTIEPKIGHPLSEGASSYTVLDEHYFMEVDDPQVDMFLTTSSEHGTQPGGWTRLQGTGRVCVLTPGHNPDVWLHPSFQSLVKNCLNWCVQDQL